MLRTPSVAPACTGLWGAAAFVVLAGIFGMHGVTGHSWDGSARGNMTMAAAVAATHSGAPAVAQIEVRPPADRVTPILSVPSEPGNGPGGVPGMRMISMLCLAVLTGSALALVLAAVHPRTAAMARATRPTPQVKLARGRDPDPPSLTALSLRRC